MPRRRERIAGFDRLAGIEIADLADRLVEVWPQDNADGDAARARGYVDTLDDSARQLARMVVALRAELARLERADEDGRPT